MRTVLYLVTLVPATLSYGGTCIVSRYLRIRRVPGCVYDRAQRNWARTILRAAGVPVSVHGAERIQPGVPEIIAANHASFFDILALLGYLPVDPKFVAKKELFAVPVFGPAIKAAGHVRLDRGNLQQAFEAYRVAAKRVRQENLHVLVYPEGTRSRTGDLLPFKKGPFVLAIECQAPVVPAYVAGAFDIQPKGSIRVHPRPISIRLGEAISTTGMDYESRDGLATRVREAMLALKADGESA